MNRRLPQLLSIFGLLALLVALGPRAVVAQDSTGTTSRVSASSNGVQGNGYSYVPTVSADGRYVAFDSEASNVVAGDTNGASDVFVHDRQTGQASRVSVSSSGAQGNSSSFVPAVSADGRYVVFYSFASNLVAGDTNDQPDIFVHDRYTGQVSRVSVSSSGAQGNDGAYTSAVSADGRYVAFESYASNLVAGDTINTRDIFVHDRQMGSTSRISVSSSGAQGNGWSDYPALSADGRYVAFGSYASNLVGGDTNSARDIFVHDRQTAQTRRVSVSSGGGQGNDYSYEPTLSADGRYVAFGSYASNLVTGDANGAHDVFVHDRQTSQTSRVSVSSGGAQGNSSSWSPAISGDGRYVAFTSPSSNLVTADTNGYEDIFVHDRQTGQTIRVSVGSGGGQGNGYSYEPALSVDGRYVAFESYASNLVAGDTNDAGDVFVHDRLGTVQPGAISDLVATSGPAAGMVTLTWAVPPGATGSLYTRIRYRSGSPITSGAAWVAATGVGNTPAPAATGQTQTFIVKGLEPGQTYHFAARLEDGATNLTPLSNSPSAAAATPERIDLTVSLWRAPNDADKARYETIFQHFADGIYEMSNGAHVIGTITVYQNKAQWETAHVQWSDDMWPNAWPAGYGEPGRHIYMGDRHVEDLWFDYQFLNQSNLRSTGYAMAHEWGHYYYGLYDEYAGECGQYCGEIWHPQPDDTPIHNSVMNSQWNAVDGNYNWLNFSVARNYINQSGQPEKNTAQLRVYDASGWETLTRSTDPRDGHRAARPKRSVYPELGAVAPPIMDHSPLELPTTAHRVPDVTVNWSHRLSRC